jgi:hypothetical protein
MFQFNGQLINVSVEIDKQNRICGHVGNPPVLMVGSDRNDAAMATHDHISIADYFNHRQWAAALLMHCRQNYTALRF